MSRQEPMATQIDMSRLADEAITEFLQAAEADEAPGRTEFIQKYSGVQTALESFFDAYDQMGGARQTDSNTYGSFVSGGQLGRHRLVHPIGTGSFGTVWLGFDTQLKRPVAIKVPNPNRFNSLEQRDLFLSEAQTVARLDHPNIVPIYDVGETESGEIYLVSRFVAGKNLATELRSRTFTSEEAATCVAGIVDALEYAHRRNVIHRDIKPSNILLDAETGQAYVTDFGLACDPDSAGTSVAGTPAYMSPEQTMGTKLDQRSDVFSVGVVFYELLCGERPFSGEDMDAIMRSIREDSPQPPSHFGTDVPGPLQQACLRSLAKPPGDRYGSMAELKSTLSPYLSTETAGPTEGAPSKSRKLSVPVIAIIGVVLVACVAIAVNWLGSDNEPTKTTGFQSPRKPIEKSIDREIAIETIRRGGHIDFRYDGEDHEVDSIDDIPDGDISLLWVMFSDGQTIDDEYLTRLCQLDSLEGIDLYSCTFSDGGFAKLGVIPSLKFVYAPDTQVDTAVKELARLPRLSKLTLSSTNVSDETLQSFEGNQTLKLLRVSDSRITDDGLRYIGSMTSLEDLNVDSCRITNDGIRHLSKLTNLKSVSFAQTDITDEALKYLSACHIKHLEIPPCISKQAERQFVKTHPGCRVIRD